jgi:antitoxin VapB
MGNTIYVSLARDMLTYIQQNRSLERASLFKSNKSQALRLPKAVAYPESAKQVDIVAIGRARLIAPAGESWDVWFDDMGVSDDFMTDRDQPAVGQDREAL